MRLACATLIVIALCASADVHARILRVGPTGQYTLPSQASAAAADGDTIDIAAGDYVDCTTWTQNNLTLRGSGGYAHVRDKSCGGKAIWIVRGNNTVIEWVEFSGATVVDKNGAGIRLEGTNLTLRHCSFHDNEDGILGGDNPASTVLIEYCEFDNNGYGDGYSHNMYLNHIAHFIIRHSWTHRAKIGHNIKSRAYVSEILYNRISNELDGTASRDIDLPNGGRALIMGNVIQHGAQTQNSNTCEFGLEGLTNPGRSLFIAHNTFVNERSGGAFLMIATGVDTLRIANNVFAGAGSILSGAPARLDSAGNVRVTSIAAAGFTSAASYDYRLLAGSPAIDAGRDPGPNGDMPMIPLFEYEHPASRHARTMEGLPDAGAYEHHSATGVAETAGAVPDALHLDIHPNPVGAASEITFTLSAPMQAVLSIHSILGQELVRLCDGALPAGTHSVRLPAHTLSPGAYLSVLRAGASSTTRLFVVR